MGHPVFCADNLLDAVIQYPAHTLTANEEASGKEAWRVANGRRHASDYWTPTTANAAAYLEVTFDRVRAFNFVALDRGHNLAGEVTRVRISDDDFATYQDVLSITQPAAYGFGTPLDSAVGARTLEGAWVKLLDDTYSASAVRFYIDAMGADLRPQVVGLWLGLAWQPGVNLPRPVQLRPRQVAYPSVRSGAGWIGAGQRDNSRAGDYRLKLRTFFTDEAERFLGRYSPDAPAWIVPDSDAAERAFLAIPPSGSDLGLTFDPGWAYPVAAVPYVEQSPRAS